MIKALRSTELKPKLVSAPNGDLYIQINVGGDYERRFIPPMDTMEEAEDFINRTVMEMAKVLYRKRRNKEKRRRKNDAED